jgi:hypothetical protein
MIPGRSSSWMRVPLYSTLPGMHVSVVNSYAATSDSVSAPAATTLALCDGRHAGSTTACALRTCHAAEQRRLSDTGEANEGHSRMAGSSDVEALALATTALRRLQQLRAHTHTPQAAAAAAAAPPAANATANTPPCAASQGEP